MKLAFLTAKEHEERDKIVDELNDAYLQRTQTYTELDDMTYDQYYLANKKAATGYLRPRRNREDLRVVTGTTREKVNTVVTALLRYNFDFTIEAYDQKDWPNRDVGIGMETMVRKTRKVEDPMWEKKRPLIYTELISQGDVFLYEYSEEEEVLHKKMKGVSVEDVMKMDWTETKKIEKRCEVDIVPGINVYLGNIREYYLNKQPFIGIRREMPRTRTKALYGHWARWKHIENTKQVQVLADMGGQEYNNWQMCGTKEGIDEEIRYFNPHTNTYQVLVNGVPMLPAGFPLEYLLGVRKYPIVKGSSEPISRYFAYSRGLAAKNKFNQAIIDEFYRIIALKFRKSTNPPMANLTGKILNKTIFDAGTVHTGVDPEKLKPIGNNAAVTGPEFDTFQLIKQAIDESSVSPIMEGHRTPGEQTAQEINTLKAQSLQKLGMIMVGAIQMEEELIWLRAYNILKNWTTPVDTMLEEVKGVIKEKNVYRSESVEDKFEDGKSGIRTVEMTDGELPEEAQILAEERLLTRKRGVEVRKVYLNAKELASLKYNLYVKVSPIEKDHTELQAALFEESMLKAMQMFPEAVNKPYVQEEWAVHAKLDPRKLFIKNAPQLPPEPIPSGAKTVGAQALPQTTQKMKPQLKQML
jgi:hypothetical protein